MTTTADVLRGKALLAAQAGDDAAAASLQAQAAALDRQLSAYEKALSAQSTCPLQLLSRPSAHVNGSIPSGPVGVQLSVPVLLSRS